MLAQIRIHFENHILPLLKQDQSHLLRYALIAGVFVFSLAVPFVVMRGYAIYLLILMVGVIGVLVLLYQPSLGFVLIILGGMLIPFSGPFGINSSLVMVVLLLGVWLLRIMVGKWSMQYVSSRTNLPVLIFIIAAILSFGFGQLPWYSFARQAPIEAQLGGLALYVLSAAVFLLVGNLVDELRWLEWITYSLIISGAFLVVIVFGLVTLHISQLYMFFNLFHQGAMGSMFWTWLTALSFSQAVFNRRLQPIIRAGLGGLVMLILYIGYFQARGWRSGWVPPLAAVVIIIGIRYWRKLFYLAPLAIIPVTILVRQSIAGDQYSYSTRLEAWQIVLEIAKVNPFLGMGFGNYYWYTPLFPIRGFAVSFISHSQYVDIIAQMGVIGLVLFLWLMWEIGRLGWGLRERVPEGFSEAYVYGVLGGLAGTLVAAVLVDWVLPFVYNIGFTGFRSSILAWIFFGGLVSLEQLVRRNADTVKS